MKTDRKKRLYFVEPSKMLELFCSWNKIDYVALPKLKDVPDDAVILSCVYVLDRELFYFVVKHDSFEDIPKGQPLPKIVAEIETVYIDKKDNRRS